MMNKIKITRRQNSESGVAAVEFAILLIPLLLIVAGVIEFGRALWYYDALVKSTRDGARYLSNSRESLEVPIGSIMEASAIAIVTNAANSANLDVSTLDVDVSCDTSCSTNTPNYVTVSVSYPITIGGWIPIIAPTGATSWSSTLSSHTTMRYMR